MSGPAAILREIHRLKKNVKDLQGEIERAPRLVRAQHTKAVRQDELYHQAQESLKKLKVSIKEKEGTLRSIHQVIAKHEKQLNEATVKKEYDALKHEIAAEKQKSQALEDEILEAMGQADEQTAKLPELEKAVNAAKSEAVRYESEAQSRQTGLQEQLKQAEAKLKEVEATLSLDALQTYERLVSSRGEDALSAVQEKNCVACYTAITAQSYNDLLSGRMVVCKVCGRMLYLPE